MPGVLAAIDVDRLAGHEVRAFPIKHRVGDIGDLATAR